MTVKTFAMEIGVWNLVSVRIAAHGGGRAPLLLERLAALPVRTSRATRRLGSYVSRGGEPVCIRLQFAQEPDNLTQTFLHELAHACDHLCHQPGRQYRRAHGANWQAWAKAFGISAETCGSSDALKQLHRQRLKLVAICQSCGAEFHRLRRLNRRRHYVHNGCGGRLQKL